MSYEEQLIQLRSESDQLNSQLVNKIAKLVSTRKRIVELLENQHQRAELKEKGHIVSSASANNLDLDSINRILREIERLQTLGRTPS